MKKRTIVTALLAVSMLLVANPATASQDSVTSPEQLHSTTVGQRLVDDVQSASATTLGLSGSTTSSGVSRGSFTISCEATAQNPHKSTGAGYAIYKTRVSCKGYGSYPSTVKVRVRGGLMWDSAKYSGDTSNGIKWSMLRSSDETRTIAVNNKLNTFYTPLLGQNGAYFTGHYQGSSTIQIITPTGQKSGSDISNVQFIKF